jgi:hypothetical protein
LVSLDLIKFFEFDFQNLIKTYPRFYTLNIIFVYLNLYIILIEECLTYCLVFICINGLWKWANALNLHIKIGRKCGQQFKYQTLALSLKLEMYLLLF